MQEIYPKYDIYHLNADKISNELFNIDRFKTYLANNPHLSETHGHLYYHLVYFTKGKGKHRIDFKEFEIKDHSMYLMRPNQVHQWDFVGEVDGYVINFYDEFLDWQNINSIILRKFSFFNTLKIEDQVLYFDQESFKTIESIFEELINIKKENKTHAMLSLATLLIQLFICVDANSKTQENNKNNSNLQHQHHQIILNFNNLLEKHFKELKLPKDYANKLNITPTQLNIITKEVYGESAGNIIRNRIILEAKRLLINFDLTVNEIAYQLNFQDVSYFIKFFKKYTNSTPEVFRHSHFENKKSTI